MLQSCSFVSLHCPLTPKTRGLIGRTELAMMPKGSMIINYARGEVIDKEVIKIASNAFCPVVLAYVVL